MESNLSPDLAQHMLAAFGTIQATRPISLPATAIRRPARKLDLLA